MSELATRTSEIEQTMQVLRSFKVSPVDRSLAVGLVSTITDASMENGARNMSIIAQGGAQAVSIVDAIEGLDDAAKLIFQNDVLESVKVQLQANAKMSRVLSDLIERAA